ncbi:hypothetical protein G5V58_16805 [Nocardioides anomalus]|uniref:LppX_LprAFG lipoprotein n=1 Tax=Nocardioides anomalus TaxID=2712223 RepID=A0A6G6WG51_9ACTN|nr:hypothetical protein [Nocardioides anomalus]QIG44212.1 hypothetical protein G5V58_16805 [Nocardioides anomalus]
MRLTVLALATALAAAALSGCGGDDPEPRFTGVASATPTPTPTSTSSAAARPTPSPTRPPELPGQPELGHDPAARRELRRAVLALLRSGSATYRLDAGTTGAGLQERGSFRLDPRAFEIRRYLSTGDGTYTFDFRAVGASAWMRAIDSPDTDGPWPCWVDVADLAAGAPSGLQQLLTSDVATTQPPNAVIAASYGVGREYTDLEQLGTILGTLDLVTAVSLLGSQAVRELGLPPDSRATVPAYFDVRDGVLRGYSVSFRSLYLALEAEGIEVPVDTGELIPGTVEVTFADQGRPVRVPAPPPAEVVDIAPGPGGFGAEMDACGA